MEISDNVIDRRSAAFALNGLGNLAFLEGILAEARQYFLDVLNSAHTLELASLKIDILVGIADLWLCEEQYEQAYRLLCEILSKPGVEKKDPRQEKAGYETYRNPTLSKHKIKAQRKKKSLEDNTKEIIETILSTP